MSSQSKTIVAHVIVNLDAALNPDQLRHAFQAISKEWVGDISCNHVVDGRMQGKYDDHPNFPQLQAAHHRVAATTAFKLKMAVHADGTLSFVSVVP